jgi:hypothetical protein
MHSGRHGIRDDVLDLLLLSTALLCKLEGATFESHFQVNSLFFSIGFGLSCTGVILF